MHFIPRSILLRSSIRLYRKIRYRKGFGVHSPFVFNLITKVIEERKPYYCFYDIELERMKLLDRHDPAEGCDGNNRTKPPVRTVAELANREAFPKKKGELLFRLVHYFGSKRIVQVGTGTGISTLYLTSCATGLKCIALESRPEYARIASRLLEKHAANPVDIRVGEYKESAGPAWEEMGKVDFVFFHTPEEENNRALFREAVKHVHAGTIFVIDGIRRNKEMRVFWREVCRHPAVTVTADLYSAGIIFFNPKLYKRNYIVYF